MKLRNEDKQLLASWGYEEQDFPQIQMAFRKDKTTYMTGGKPVTREKVIELLGRREFLYGIARSAFHMTAYRVAESGEGVLFDSGRLFGQEG